MSTNTISLQRVITASPEKVFKAFSDPDAYASWIPPYGFICTIQQMDFVEGGVFKMTFTNFSTGNSHSFGGKYLKIELNRFIKNTDKFDDPNLSDEMTTSIWFEKVSCGTEIKIIQAGIPSVIPPEMCYLGWQESLEKLKKLVEPEIPDA
jgi:uncharacterized protein YndB with AHSA1/START domain